MWTTQYPREAGFYWWKNGGHAPQVVEVYWSAYDAWWVLFTGTDEAQSAETGGGEFWSERLTAPEVL